MGELEGRLLALPLAATAVQYLEPLDSDGLVSQNDEVSVKNSELEGNDKRCRYHFLICFKAFRK